MRWTYPILDVHEASLRAECAEKLGQWHVVVQHSLYCLERSQSAEDNQAIHYFATRLSTAYVAMDMLEKATFYARLTM